MNTRNRAGALDKGVMIALISGAAAIVIGVGVLLVVRNATPPPAAPNGIALPANATAKAGSGAASDAPPAPNANPYAGGPRDR